MRNFKEAMDDFQGSTEWVDCADPVTLMAPPRMRIYIENRLKRAFQAGWNSRSDLAAEQAGRVPQFDEEATDKATGEHNG